MSSPAWDLRRANARQAKYQRPWLRALKAQGITWPPVAGQIVCDCRFLHLRVASVSPDADEYEMEDGGFCGLSCLDPLDHDFADHPSGFRGTEGVHPHPYVGSSTPQSFAEENA